MYEILKELIKDEKIYDIYLLEKCAMSPVVTIVGKENIYQYVVINKFRCVKVI